MLKLTLNKLKFQYFEANQQPIVQEISILIKDLKYLKFIQISKEVKNLEFKKRRKIYSRHSL